MRYHKGKIDVTKEAFKQYNIKQHWVIVTWCEKSLNQETYNTENASKS